MSARAPEGRTPCDFVSSRLTPHVSRLSFFIRGMRDMRGLFLFPIP